MRAVVVRRAVTATHKPQTRGFIEDLKAVRTRTGEGGYGERLESADIAMLNKWPALLGGADAAAFPFPARSVACVRGIACADALFENT